jgi:hypothetical protein
LVNINEYYKRWGWEVTGINPGTTNVSQKSTLGKKKKTPK